MASSDSAPRKMTSAEYRSLFGVSPTNREKLEAALTAALDSRKFEIELYWKRATYFWTLIAAAFAGYFAVRASGSAEHDEMAYLIACVGFTFTYAWFQVNRGSKQWQENWENHVYMLEDEVMGPLYKTMLRRPNWDGRVELYITGPGMISVSKVNQLIGVSTLAIWAVLASDVVGPVHWSYPVNWPRVLASIITIVTCLAMTTLCKTYLGDHLHLATTRNTDVQSEEMLAKMQSSDIETGALAKI